MSFFGSNAKTQYAAECERRFISNELFEPKWKLSDFGDTEPPWNILHALCKRITDITNGVERSHRIVRMPKPHGLCRSGGGAF